MAVKVTKRRTKQEVGRNFNFLKSKTLPRIHHNMRVSTVKFIRSLSLKQLRCHHDTTWIDLRVSKLFNGFLAVVESKSLVRRSVAQLGSAVGIDVVHHMVNVSLRESVKGCTFR